MVLISKDGSLELRVGPNYLCDKEPCYADGSDKWVLATITGGITVDSRNNDYAFLVDYDEQVPVSKEIHLSPARQTWQSFTSAFGEDVRGTRIGVNYSKGKLLRVGTAIELVRFENSLIEYRVQKDKLTGEKKLFSYVDSQKRIHALGLTSHLKNDVAFRLLAQQRNGTLDQYQNKILKEQLSGIPEWVSVPFFSNIVYRALVGDLQKETFPPSVVTGKEKYASRGVYILTKEFGGQLSIFDTNNKVGNLSLSNEEGDLSLV